MKKILNMYIVGKVDICIWCGSFFGLVIIKDLLMFLQQEVWGSNPREYDLLSFKQINEGKFIGNFQRGANGIVWRGCHQAIELFVVILSLYIWLESLTALLF